MSECVAVFKMGDEDQQLVYAEVYAPNVPDVDGDFMDAETIHKMAHKFMTDLNLKKIDVQHDNKLVEACVVESFIARKGDPDFIEGAWVVGVHVADKELWGRIKKGEINGFSMEALVHRTPMEVEVEIPPVLQGLTSKGDDGHEHEFFVSYNDKGDFQGGRTSFVNGHYHVIKRGTVTETESGHNHRFSFMEQISTQVQKANPYHDDLGRFTTAGNAMSVGDVATLTDDNFYALLKQHRLHDRVSDRVSHETGDDGTSGQSLESATLFRRYGIDELRAAGVVR